MTALLLMMLAQAPDAPLANPDAPGSSVILKAGDVFTAPGKAVCLDEQEDVHRERRLVDAETAAKDWRTIAYVSIGSGAALTVALAVLSGMAAAHKL